jgi:predicted dehydrogenase
MIKAAIVGLGWWGRQIVGSLQGRSGRIRFIRGVDADPEAVRAFAAEKGFPVTGDYEGILVDPEVEAVFIVTPHDLHEAQIIRAAAAGKHVFCEKPLTLTRASAERAVDACEAAGVLLGVGHERRFEPAMIEIKRMIDEGELGTILHVESNFSHDSLRNLPADNWRVSHPFIPPAMTGMGTHLTDSYLHLLGPVEKLYAQPSWRVAGWKAGDGIAVTFRFASGATGLLSSLMATPFFMRFQVFGTEAWVEARDTVRPEVVGTVHFTVRRRGGEPLSREIPSIDSVAANIEAFADAVAGKRVYPFTRAEKIGNVAVLEAIARSVETGEAVLVPSVR